MSNVNAQNQCCTLEQAKRLNELWINQDVIWYWSCFFHHTPDAKFEICRRNKHGIYYDQEGWFDALHFPVQTPLTTYAAYNVAELGAMLLKEARDCYYHQPSGMWSHSNAGWMTIQVEKKGAVMHEDIGTHNLFSTQAECYGDRLLYLMHQYPIKYPAEFVNTRLKKFYELKRETV